MSDTPFDPSRAEELANELVAGAHVLHEAAAQLRAAVRDEAFYRRLHVEKNVEKNNQLIAKNKEIQDLRAELAKARAYVEHQLGTEDDAQ